MTLKEHVSLAPLTTFAIGGEARYFISIESPSDIAPALACAREHALPVCVLGGGSNVLIADSGFDGLVLHIALGGITAVPQGDQVLLKAGAGVVWDELVQYAIKHDLAGFECLSGVPGTVGGAVVANLGCYGAECSDTFVSAEVLDLSAPKEAVHTFTKEACEFSYHDSVFARNPRRFLVLEATFKLSTKWTPHLSYRDNRFDLAALAERNGRTPTLIDVRNAILDVREEKGNLVMPGRLSYKGAGSFFHMPFISAEQYAQVVACARDLDTAKEERLRPWAWSQPDGSYKIAPGFLLEYTDFQKGYVRDAVGISPKHTLTILNLAGARASDVAALARDMQEAVKKLFDIHLEREVEYMGNVESEK